MFIQQKVKNNVTFWTINRPERMNALGPTLGGELAQSLIKFHEQIISSRALVIRAAPQSTQNRRVWIAGGDLKELSKLRDPNDYAHRMSEVCHKLETLPVPVVTVIEGAAIGGGAEFALAGDVRVASRDSTFDFRQLNVGLATGFGGAKRLVDLVGKGLAQRILYLSNPIDADQALAWGLIHKVSELADLESDLEQILTNLTALYMPAFAAQKAMLNDATHSHDASECRKRELHHFLRLWGNPVHKSTLDKFNQP